MRKINLSGKRFGRLLVLFESNSVAGKSMWTCQCDCKKSVVVRGTHMTGGKVNSCGCLRHELFIERVTTHGLSKTRPYRIWRDMINRCHYENYPERHLYGGRGIEVCVKWRESFEEFINYMGFPPPNLSIDRINVNGNYEPGNCRWATAKEQAANTRRRAKDAA